MQRRSWTVRLEELGGGDFRGISRDLVLAVERLRAARDLPRHVYIRPTEQALRRSGVEGRDKDTKPVYVDLESYLFLEIFHRWLTKAGEVEVPKCCPRRMTCSGRKPTAAVLSSYARRSFPDRRGGPSAERCFFFASQTVFIRWTSRLPCGLTLE